MMKWVNFEELANLHAGDLVMASSGETYVVVANYGEYVTAVRVTSITNPSTWKVWRDEAKNDALALRQRIMEALQK